MSSQPQAEGDEAARPDDSQRQRTEPPSEKAAKESDPVREFRPNLGSLLGLAVISGLLAVAVTVLEDGLLGGSGTLPAALMLAIAGLVPLGRALSLKKRYVVRIGPTWVSGPDRKAKTQLKVQREEVVGLRPVCALSLAHCCRFLVRERES